ELLTGHPAFNAPSLMELGAAILGDEPVPAGILVRAVSPELDAIILRCLQKRPEARYQNVAELAAALYPFGPRRARKFAERCHSLLQCVNPELQQLTLASVAPPPSRNGVTLNPGVSVSSIPPPRKSRRKVYIALGAVLTAAAATAGFISQSPEALGESYDRAKVAATALSGPWSNGSATDGVGE